MAQMDFPPLQSLSYIPNDQKSALRQGHYTTVTDLLLADPSEIVRKCKLQHATVVQLLDTVCGEFTPKPRTLENFVGGPELFTSGNSTLDTALGGGIRTGMIWEIVGESAAGKSQMALQLSLTVQLSRELGGLEGSACILLTSKSLYTNRLLEMVEYHPLLSSNNCGLSDIHTTRTSIIPELLRALKTELPKFCQEKASDPESKRVKLVVIDTLTELFHVDGETRATSLWQRAKDLAEISSCLHSLAHRHNVAVIVLNEVTDAFEPPVGDTNTDDLLYRNQARFFNRADSIPGENMKEAALGLVWANQVNARIMLTRTERMRELEDTEARPSKRRRLDSNARPSTSQSNFTRIRRLTVIFSSVAPPTSLDYIITAQGISALTDSEEPRMPTQQPIVQPPAPITQTRHLVQDVSPPPDEIIPSSQSQPLLPTFVELPSDDQHPQPLSDGVEVENGPEPEEDEWDAYWREVDNMDDLYADLDPSIPSSSLPANPLYD